MEYIHFGKEGGETYVILPGLSLKSVLGSADAIKAAYKTLAEDYDIYLLDHIDKEPESSYNGRIHGRHGRPGHCP